MKKLITSLALALTALSSYAITPLWMRDARISPNGTEIVFCYKGDIYKVRTGWDSRSVDNTSIL